MSRPGDFSPANFPDTDLRVFCIQQEERFFCLVSDWNRLADLVDESNVFFRHEWHEAAWQWARLDSELHILCVQQGDEVVGIFPLVLRRSRLHGIAVRSIEFLSVPDSQVCDILTSRDRGAVVIPAAVNFLHSNRNLWDVVVLDKLRAGSPTRDMFLNALSAHGFQAVTRESTHDFGLSLIGGWEAFYSRRSRRLKKGNNLIANHLKKTYEKIDVDWLHGESADDAAVTSALDSAIEISAASWKQGTRLTLDIAGPNAFIQKLTQIASAKGWLSLWILRLDGVAVAMEYQISFRGHVHALRADYDQKYQENSPGTYLSWKLTEKLFDAGLEYYHMGPGENPYKRRWAEDVLTLHELVGFSDNWRGRLVAWWRLRMLAVMKRLAETVKRAAGRRGDMNQTSSISDDPKI